MSLLLNLFSRPAALRALREARALLKDQTPMRADCGRLCNAACCQSDETGENGMLLFPFEESFYKEPIEGFAYHLADDDTLFKGGKRLVCQGRCVRDQRPLACRLFPLRIRIQSDESGDNMQAVPELDPRAFCCCPLLDGGDINALSSDFVEAARLAGEKLIRNVYMLEALYNEQKMLDETRKL